MGMMGFRYTTVVCILYIPGVGGIDKFELIIVCMEFCPLVYRLCTYTVVLMCL